MGLIKICNKIIEYSFYGLFLLVPIVLWEDTSELFELNKMWLTWGITIVIGVSWFTKMILQRRILFQRTPLDIPILLFLTSQIISTIFSLDPHVSLWGYYSRFNGGLLSIISYIFLYYAFLSNSPSIAKVQRLMIISLISGLFVALWGLPSHFGYDPTCFLFRGTLDVSCWTADFQPRARIFSTLGQPTWLAAYLAILLPITIAFWFQKTQNQVRLGQNTQNVRKSVSQLTDLIVKHSETLVIRVCRVFWNKQILYLLLSALFYVDLLFTGARSGVLGIWLSLIFFAALYYWISGKPKISISYKKLKSPLAILFFGFLIITFIIGTPINQLRIFTLDGIKSYFQKTETQNEVGGPARPNPPAGGEGGTESGNIRINVWTGAINAWKANPLFGTGVETFAFAYYKYKPTSQNLTSEWNFLYNKAHNEYLNYLATTGIVGLGTYLLMVGTFLFMVIKKILFSENSEHSGNQKFRQSDNLNVRKSGSPSFPSILVLALLAGYISILVTNFFGFSVVITNIYLFMIPAFVFVLCNMIKDESKDQRPKTKDQSHDTSVWQWTPIFFVSVIGLFMLIMLFRFWRADIAFALGYNLGRAGEYQQAYPALHKAVELRGSEPVFKDELSVNDAIIAAGLLAQQPSDDQKQQTFSVASNLVQESINTSNEIISRHPNNAIFWKTRVRVFYTLSQIDSRYLPKALDGIEKASLLAPWDANIWYNLGVLYGQNNNISKGIEALEKTLSLKPDYRDAHYALGLFYHTASLDEKGKVVVNEELDEKALAQMQYILDHLNPQDPGALESIKAWKQ